MTSGYIAPGFERVRDAFEAQLSEELGASFAAIRDGETLVDICGGFADRAQTKPWARDTLVPIYSATKPIAALVLATLQDTHGLSFEARVADVWPEFAANGKADVTIAQLLSHQAGVPGFIDPIDPALWLDPPALAAQLATIAPLWPPGTANGYHPMTWGYAVGELVRRVAGRSLGTILRDDICAPREIDFWIGLPDREHARCADMRRPPRMPDLGPITPPKQAAFLNKWATPDRSGPEWRRIEIPSANGHGGALAVAQLYALYATEGDGVLSRAAFNALTASRSFKDDLVLPFKLDWRAGVLGNNSGFFGPEARALGHYGWGGACGVADASRRLSIAYAPNKQSHHLMGDPRAMALIAALYDCL